VTPADLPIGSSPRPLSLPHFPSRLHAFVWRNWTLVPLGRLAEVLGASPGEVLGVGRSMGLGEPPGLDEELRRRSYITVIRRNWHLLPYEQLLQLLGWTAEELAFVLREDDFLWIKLGSLKPACEPLRYAAPDEAARSRAAEIAGIVRETFPDGPDRVEEPPFHFVRELSTPLPAPSAPAASRFSPRYCYSYFALYGDPFLEPELDPYPDGYLQRLAACGADGVWLQAVLYKLFPFPWDASLSERHEERLENLKALVARLRAQGIGLYLYLNEPRAMPLAFFEEHPELKGVVEGDHAVLCTSVPEVREYLASAVEAICRAVPDLAGFFTITASENLTSCWSHHRGEQCPRCGERTAAEVIAEVNATFFEGIRRAQTGQRLIAWDWGWQDDQAEATIRALPVEVDLMSVSEWSLPLNRGGVESIVGEYSVTVVGPGPRAPRHWAVARERGMRCLAKIQANTTWECSSVPYLPCVANVAETVANLRDMGVDGLMLGWTLGGHPSPNLEVVAELGRGPEVTAEAAMQAVAARRYGELAPAMVEAWKQSSAALQEFPYSCGTVYSAPLQTGPANLLWAEPTGYRATMCGIPYDDLKSWRQVYPPEVFVEQLRKVADGLTVAQRQLAEELYRKAGPGSEAYRDHLLATAAIAHFASTGVQTQFVMLRDALLAAEDRATALGLCDALEAVVQFDMSLTRSVHHLQVRDSRIGFEATNHYFYVPLDLAEKVLNCRDLVDRWLPAQRRKWEGEP
jgi:hypothetical protein